jgi:hypothetical protein
MSEINKVKIVETDHDIAIKKLRKEKVNLNLEKDRIIFKDIPKISEEIKKNINFWKKIKLFFKVGFILISLIFIILFINELEKISRSMKTTKNINTLINMIIVFVVLGSFSGISHYLSFNKLKNERGKLEKGINEINEIKTDNYNKQMRMNEINLKIKELDLLILQERNKNELY